MYPPQDPYEPYIDGLRVKADSPDFKVRDPTTATTRTRWDTSPLRGTGPRLTRSMGRGIILLLVLITAACCCGGWFVQTFIPKRTVYVNHTSPPKVETPAPKPSIVTVTTTPEIPESCKQAIRDMLAIIDSASKITSVSSKQLDILSEAYQAILLGDTARLNQVADIQRQLERELEHDQVTVQTPYEHIKDGIATCPA